MKKLDRLNPQGLARRDPLLMSCILSDPGRITVSIDLSAGEPSVTAHFSGDPNYYAATFGMVGKAPYYNSNGLLMISDIYLMVMSKSPMGKDVLWKAFHEGVYEGLTFAEMWLKDSEYITKKILKEPREFHKMLGLAAGYGMQAKKMVKSSYEKGKTLSIQDAKGFLKDGYWGTFKDVRKFADALSAKAARDTYIVNEFGYRLKPEPHKAFNYVIQSSVSGIMHVFAAKLVKAAPYSRFITCIHDELLMDIPENMVDDFRKDAERATDSLNDDLGWSVRIRTGFAVGKTWYEAK